MVACPSRFRVPSVYVVYSWKDGRVRTLFNFLVLLGIVFVVVASMASIAAFFLSGSFWFLLPPVALFLGVLLHVASKM